MKVNKGFFFAAIISVTLLATSCAPHRAQDSLRQESSYEKAFASALAALEDVQFSIVSSDIDTGKIVAEKRLFHSLHRLEISVEEVPEGVKVGIGSVAPLEAKRETNNLAKEFSRALRKRVPKQPF